MKIELFFDYACPYCYRGHKNLLQLIAKYPELEIEWRPCEAHPRPEVRSIYSDLAIQGMYFIQENGGDIWAYHQAVYQAMFDEKEDISDLVVLRRCAEKAHVDGDTFSQAIRDNRYEQLVLDHNEYAWGEKALDAVPSYISGDCFIGSRNGILVSEQELDQFLASLR